MPSAWCAAAVLVIIAAFASSSSAVISGNGSNNHNANHAGNDSVQPVVVRLPNTAKVDGQLTANLGVDHFFSLWIVFNNDDVVISDEPFTILAPRNAAVIKDKRGGVQQLQLQHPDSVKRLLSDHIVIGARVDLNTARTYTTLGGRNFTLTKKENTWHANAANVLESRDVQPNGVLIVLDDFLFADVDAKLDTAKNDTKENQSQSPTTTTTTEQPQKDAKETKSIVKDSNVGAAMTVITVKEAATSRPTSLVAVAMAPKNVTFIYNVMQVLSLLKSGVRVFQHFLSRSNVSKLLNDEDEYTVFVPTDHAFQRWHPIDWGFYPFSVPEFTESVIINHFIKGKLKQDGIKTDQTAKTLGGKEVVFRKAPNLTVNGASAVKGDTPLPKGNIMFISEVLFVSESVVSRLHQQHRDKETPPLLAFPWFGAQFLSHAFLALERDRRFTHITRFLNLADLAPHVSGAGYTFFVPTDTAFEEIGLDKMPDNYLSTGDGLEILLNHFVKGRLYDRDLTDSLKLLSLGNKIIDIGRRRENVTVNKAHIVESEVFVYNLGTMFYIDKVLFAKPELLPKMRRTTTTTTTTPLPSSAPPPTTIVPVYDNLDDNADANATTAAATTTQPPPPPPPTPQSTMTIGSTMAEEDVESVPEELSESGGSMPDILFADAESERATTTSLPPPPPPPSVRNATADATQIPPPTTPTTTTSRQAPNDTATTATSRSTL